MITRNGDMELGIVNGATGILAAVKYDRHDEYKQMQIRLDDTGKVVKIHRTLTNRIWENRSTYSKSTFPCILCYAITAHKAQGATIASSCLIHATSCFAAGLMYVMLSRVTERRHLKIVGRLTPEDFTPVPMLDLMRPNQHFH